MFNTKNDKSSPLNRHKFWRFTPFLFIVILVLLDQVTKIAIKGMPPFLNNILNIQYQGLTYGEVIPVITNLLQWTYIENQGMAFGITFGWAKPLLSILSLVASALIMCYLYNINKPKPYKGANTDLSDTTTKDENKWVVTSLPLTLLAAGALGNGIDRCFHGVLYGDNPILYGGVVDFILVDIPDIALLGWSHFPVFNIADSCVTCGVILLMITQFITKKS